MRVLASVNRNNNASAYFFTPHFEVLDAGGLREIFDRKAEFPNNGAFFMPQQSEEVEMYMGRLIRVNVDTEYVSPKHNPDLPYSSAYLCNPKDIDHLNSSDIIEIIDYNMSIEDITNFDENRIISLPNKPLNNRILLRIGEYIYGCFEYTVVPNPQTSYQTSEVNIKIYAAQNSEIPHSILKFRSDAFEIHTYEVKLSHSYNDIRKFIYSQDLLSRIRPVDALDFIDNNSLLNTLKRLTMNRESMSLTNDQMRTMKEVLNDLKAIPFRESRIKRLSDYIDLSSNLADFRAAVLDEYFDSPKSAKDKEEYLNNHLDKITDLIASVDGYHEIKKQLEKEKYQLQEEIRVANEDLAKVKAETKEYAQEAVKDKQGELDRINSLILESTERLEQLSKKLNVFDDYDKLQKKINELKRDNDNLEYNKGQLVKFKDALGREIDGMTRDIRDKLTSLAGSKMDSDILDFMFRTIQDQRTLAPTQGIKSILPEEVDTELSLDDIVRTLMDNMNNKAKRRITYNEAINLLISITQNFITVFAGLPGVGKTTLCSILAKTLGLYGKRFVKIPVERGWTSRKDLIGYYNPISKTVEKTNIDLFNCLVTVDSEQKQGRGNIPYMVLLDEANLSPIEHYWANFMTLCDSHTDDPIVIGDVCRFYLSDAFRMIATINYDHTTEALSHRFLDRAWVILMEAPDYQDMFEYAHTEEGVINRNKIVDFDLLKKHFMPNKDDVLQSQVSNLMNEIIALFKPLQPISARSIKAVHNYCAAAQRLMDVSKEGLIPLDYAVSQKILPLINGNGDTYLEMLEKLINICKQNSLYRCTTILESIKCTGVQQYGYYNFFNR